jgi:apolipoprotein N-acyltransferase
LPAASEQEFGPKGPGSFRVPLTYPDPVKRVVLAGLLGLALALSFPPLSWWPLALVSVGGFTLLCRSAGPGRAAVLGASFGFAFMLVSMWWLRSVVSGAPWGLALAETPFYLLLGVALALVGRLPGWPIWAACAWVAVETARGSVPFGGFPWARLGTTVVDTPLVAWARMLGEGGLTFVVAFAAILIASAVVLARGPAVFAVAGAAALLVGSLALPVGLQGAAGRDVTVAVVQGDVPGRGIDSFSEPRVTLENHAAATRDLADDVRAGRVARPDVVIWPENASDVDPLDDPSAGALIQDAVDDLGVPVLVGAVTDGPGEDEVQGTGIVWWPADGPGERYAKRKLVPFGEWVPLRAAVTPIVPLLQEEIPRDFVPGGRAGVVDVGGTTIGAVMCFEVAYDAAIRDIAGSDVDLLAVQTNNATYLGTGQLEQQWAITRMRAVETGRAVAVASTTGISGVVAPDGRSLERTDSRERAVIVQTVEAGSGTTPGVRWGGAVEAGLAFAAALAVVVAAVRARGAFPELRGVPRTERTTRV